MSNHLAFLQYMDQTKSLFDTIDEGDDLQDLVKHGKVIGEDAEDLKSPSKSYITISQVCRTAIESLFGCLMIAHPSL